MLRGLNIEKSNAVILPWLGIISLAAGVVNGVVGAGGGLIYVVFLEILFKKTQKNSKEALKNVFVMSGYAILLLCIVSLAFRFIVGDFKPNGTLKYAIPAIIGGVAGGLVLNKANPVVIKKIFAVLLIYSGIKMAFF